MLRVNNLTGFGGGMVLPVELSLTATDSSTLNQADYTFTSQSFGATDPTRVLFVVTGSYGATSNTEVTVGGVTATLQSGQAGTPVGDNYYVAIYRVPTDPGGTSGTVFLNPTGSGNHAWIAVIRCVNWLNPGAPYDTDGSDAGSISLNIPAGGFAISGGAAFAALTLDTGLTARWSFSVESSFDAAGGFDVDMSVETGRVIDYDVTDTTMVAASFSL